MKKSLLSVFTMVAMAAAFTACSNDDIERGSEKRIQEAGVADADEIDRASCSLGNGCYGK